MHRHAMSKVAHGLSVRVAIDCGPPILAVIVAVIVAVVATNPYQAIHRDNELLFVAAATAIAVAAARSGYTLSSSAHHGALTDSGCI